MSLAKTIEIPDELYRKVEAKTADLGLRVGDVTVELYEKWLAEDDRPVGGLSGEEWLDAWVAMGREVCRDAPPGPTGREWIQQDRQRLEAN